MRKTLEIESVHSLRDDKMITVMTHMDSDGVISLALFLKAINRLKVRAYFTSPVQLRDTICMSIQHKKSLGELYIFDLAGENKAVYAAAIYDKVLWIDHHEWHPDVDFEHVEVVIDDKAKSAANVVARYFKISSPLVELADQIDTNSVKDENAERIRLIVGAIRYRYSGIELTSHLKNLAYDLSMEDMSVLSKYDDIVSEYSQWVEELKRTAKEKTKIFHVGNLKVGIYETTESIPVYLVGNELDDDLDIIVILIHRIPREGTRKSITKLEFRTHTDKDVLKIAKFYGGGGHKKASGASVNDIITIPEILKAIELLYL